MTQHYITDELLLKKKHCDTALLGLGGIQHTALYKTTDSQFLSLSNAMPWYHVYHQYYILYFKYPILSQISDNITVLLL